MPDAVNHSLGIQNLKARYCAAADLAVVEPDQARAAFSKVFAQEVVGDYGMGEIHGGDAITDFLCTAIATNSAWMIHMLHSPQIEIEGTSARGDWTVSVHSKRRESGVVDLVIGRYVDEFVMFGGKWRIARLKFKRYE